MPLIEANVYVNCAKWKIKHSDSCSTFSVESIDIFRRTDNEIDNNSHNLHSVVRSATVSRQSVVICCRVNTLTDTAPHRTRSQSIHAHTSR